MLKIFQSFKLIKYRKSIFTIFLYLSFIFPHQGFASETYGDAMNWYNNNGSSYNPKQNYLLGLKAEQEGEITKALKYFRNASKNDLTKAQIKLSSLLLKSNNRDHKVEARKIYQKLTKKYNPAATLKLGWMFEKGIGGKKDVFKAIELYKLAASMQEHQAYLSLANLSLANADGKNNIFEAIGYTSIAKDKNVPGAEEFLNNLMPLLESSELNGLELLISSMESEISKLIITE